jgi:hypothetical protein
VLAVKSFLLIVVILLTGSADAQMRKCVGADGKVTYSDVLCANTADRDTLILRAPTTEERSQRQVEATNASSTRATAQTATIRAQIMSTEYPECQFEYYASGGARAQAVVENARRECKENKVAEAIGGQQRNAAYLRWRDYIQLETARRFR